MKIIILVLIAIFVHSLIGLYINKFKFLEKKPVTNYELVPFTNIYLLGKYAFNEVVGAILFICSFFVVKLNFTVDGVKYGLTILPEGMRHVLFIIYCVMIVITLIYAISKYYNITKEKDKFKFEDLIYYLKETIWIVILFVAIYLLFAYVHAASLKV